MKNIYEKLYYPSRVFSGNSFPKFPLPQMHLFDLFGSTVTLKMRIMSPKLYQVFNMPQCYVHANLVPIRLLVHEISCTQESVMLA